MNKINYFLCTLALSTACFQMNAQTKEEQEAADKVWMAYMTPGPMHEMLAKANGEWNAEITTWSDPAAAPTKTNATCVNQMLMGNRYQESKHTGNFGGMPFEGTGILGYDNARKVFTSTWIDNVSTGIMYTEGKYDAKNKAINFTGKSVDPMTVKTIGVREVFKMIDDNTQSFQMFITQNGKETKTMEIKYTRKM